jgi:hypothetical protein
MLKVILYQSTYKESWNHFVKNAKNGHFMFCREYMEYHSYRFRDHSLMFMLDDKLVALLPSNLDDNILYSHQGLTFGGIISNNFMTTPLMLTIFDKLIEYLKKNNFSKLIYKAIPYIYSTVPAQEDLYALNVYEANLFRVDVSSTIDIDNKIELSSRRKRGVKKALKSDLKVEKSQDYENFYIILSEMLTTKHNTTPTHSLLEIKLLTEFFPDNILLYSTVNSDNKMLAAVLVFEMNNWVHAQYIVLSQEGKEVGALDLLFDQLINVIYKSKKYFDFGISTENQGKLLNIGLINQKEEFGARAIIHNFFELSSGSK